MTITLAADLELALQDAARRQGVTTDVLVDKALRDRFLCHASLTESQDEWEGHLRQAATDCGVSLSNEALSSEGLYD